MSSLKHIPWEPDALQGSRDVVVSSGGTAKVEDEKESRLDLLLIQRMCSSLLHVTVISMLLIVGGYTSVSKANNELLGEGVESSAHDIVDGQVSIIGNQRSTVKGN